MKEAEADICVRNSKNEKEETKVLWMEISKFAQRTKPKRVKGLRYITKKPKKISYLPYQTDSFFSQRYSQVSKYALKIFLLGAR